MAPMRSTPLCAVARGGTRNLIRKFKRLRARDQSRSRSLIEEELQTGEVVFVEIEVNVFGQVALESPRREIELDRSGFGNLADSLEAILLGRAEVSQDLRRDGIAPARPKGKYGGLAGHLAPLMDHVVHEEGLESGHGHIFRVALAAVFAVGRFSGEGFHFERNPQGGIADQERG